MNNYTLYVVRKEFRSGEMSTTLKKGEVIEVDTHNRMCRHRGSERPVRAILSAISMGWIGAPRPDELQSIRVHGVSHEREYETPDLAKVAADRAKQMQETLPEDLRGENFLSEEQVQSARLQDVQADDQYEMEGAAKTQRISGQDDKPKDPVTQVIAGENPDRQLKQDAPVLPQPGEQHTAQAQADAQAIQERALAAAALFPSSEDTVPSESEDLSEYKDIPTEEELASVKAADAKNDIPSYDGDFKYQVRLSKDREKSLHTMPIAELSQLSAFLIHRDKTEEKDRKVTATVKEILKSRSKEVSAALKKAMVKTAQPTATVASASTTPTYEGDFNYQVRLSGDREKSLWKMPLDELKQLSVFLSYRDKTEEKTRKVTEKVNETLKSREATRDAMPPIYEGDFNYQVRLSGDREKALWKMPLDELDQFAAFLSYRDRTEQKTRKITDQVYEILKSRRLTADSALEGKVPWAASKEPVVAQSKHQVPAPHSLSFNYDTSKPEKSILHDAQMKLSSAQVNELAHAFHEVGHPLAKTLADIARQRVENSSPTVNNQERSIASTPSIDPGEAAIASAMLGGTRTIRPNTGEPGSNVGAVSNPSESDLLNAATPAPPQLPHLAAGPKINPVNPVTELNQSSKAIDVSPVNLLPGETQVTDVANAAQPNEVQPFIGSEEGVTQVYDISKATGDAIKGQPEGKDPNISDISGGIGQQNY